LKSSTTEAERLGWGNCLDIERRETAIFYGSGLVLSRPDQHVAWRGHTPPADSLALIDRVRGAAN
jgi:hypothetical protein